ncbi:high affinity immunoglobulin epsilon receptor subunit gamma [Ambystoma mexicanum]|uniref:high affinity immunoglobulin epsilon receptor subunit gamma n=1 Tax=Ambystoma mexicanum TaxID=8296 RepID=UPI0037E82D87
MHVWLYIVVVLLAAVGKADALKEPEICYILDAVLFCYGIILTVLYCRLKMRMRQQKQQLKGDNQQALYEPLKQVDKQVYSEIPKMGVPSKQEPGQKEEGIYTGLQAQSQETYETLQMHEKPN